MAVRQVCFLLEIKLENNMREKSNIIRIVKELNRLGYTEELRVKDEKLYWVEESVKYNADQFEIDHAYRFESSDSPKILH